MRSGRDVRPPGIENRRPLGRRFRRGPGNQNRRARRPGGWLLSSFERLDRGADLAQDRADLSTEEDQGDDRDDRDEGEDQRVLGETLAFLVTTKGGEERVDERH